MNHPVKAGSWTDEQVATALSTAKAKLETLRDRRREPLAVSGIGWRFPQASGPDGVSHLRLRARVGIHKHTEHRWVSSVRP